MSYLRAFSLKYYLYILFFFLQVGIHAQVAPPSLRCLQVINTTGDLKLTWIPPSDPQNNFFGYVVFASNNLLGPYAAVTASAGPISATNFVYTTTVTTAQPLYVYVVSRYGAAGTSTSISSDTLHSIFLNINTSITDAYKLIYNDVHTPKLSTTSSTMGIWREFPPGTWTNLANTNLYNYFDTLNICNSQSVTINYSVSMSDNSGCVSSSNLQGGQYRDKHDPYQLLVDSISVLEDGTVILGWSSPYDKDVIGYEIQQQISGKNEPIDALNGYNTLSYTLSGTAANTGTVGLYVKALDSCSNGGTIDYTPVTMFLKSHYEFCTFETLLEWTPYQWLVVNGKPIDEVLEYRIYMSEDSGATYKRIGKTTGLNFRHSNVTAGKNIRYFVRVVNKRQTMTAASNRRSFYSGQVNIPDFVYMRAASVIKKNNNELRIFVDHLKPFSRMMIDRSDNGLDFDTIASLPYKGLRNYLYEDEKVSTDHQYYFYRVRLLDSCGNERLTSNVCRTMLLTVSEIKENYFERQLEWTPYEGFDAGTGKYEIYRAVNDVHAIDLVGTTDSAGLFIDNLEYAAPLGARIEYVIKAVEGFGNKYAVQDNSTSNYGQAYMEGRLFVPNAFAPNGVNKTWKPITQYVENREYNVTVINRWGQTVFETSDVNKAWDGADCSNDVYAYIVSFRNSRGEYQQVTGSVMLIK